MIYTFDVHQAMKDVMYACKCVCDDVFNFKDAWIVRYARLDSASNFGISHICNECVTSWSITSSTVQPFVQPLYGRASR